MSANEHEGGEQPLETGRPSVRLTRNAKGDVQIDVKVYASSTDELGVEDAAKIARATFDELARTYPMKATR